MKVKSLFRLYRNNRLFALSLIMTVLTMAFFIKLGLWQLHRSHEKQALIQRYLQHSQATPITLEQIHVINHDELQFRQLTVRGHFDRNHTFLLDNRFHQHQLGYQVLTPFYPQNQKQSVLINRGWIAKEKANHLITPTENISLRGYIDFPAATFRLSSQLDHPHDWPRIIETVDFAYLSEATTEAMHPFVIKLLATEPYGYVRDWSQVTTMPPEVIKLMHFNGLH